MYCRPAISSTGTLSFRTSWLRIARSRLLILALRSVWVVSCRCRAGDAGLLILWHRRYTFLFQGWPVILSRVTFGPSESSCMRCCIRCIPSMVVPTTSKRRKGRMWWRSMGFWIRSSMSVWSSIHLPESTGVSLKSYSITIGRKRIIISVPNRDHLLQKCPY